MSYQGKKNMYLCDDCGRAHLTLDVDEGVTPFMMQCLHCGGRNCHSMFYRVPEMITARANPAVEWYRPTESDVASMSASVRDHVRRGGLISRVIDYPKMGVDTQTKPPQDQHANQPGEGT